MQAMEKIKSIKSIISYSKTDGLKINFSIKDYIIIWLTLFSSEALNNIKWILDFFYN